MNPEKGYNPETEEAMRMAKEAMGMGIENLENEKKTTAANPEADINRHESAQAMKEMNETLGIETPPNVEKEIGRQERASEVREGIEQTLKILEDHIAQGNVAGKSREKITPLTDEDLEDITDTPEGAIDEVIQMQKAREAIEKMSDNDGDNSISRAA